MQGGSAAPVGSDVANWTAMAQSAKYEFKEDPTATAIVQSAVRLIKLILQNGVELLPEHRRMVLDAALWKITEAESVHKHRTRFCSLAVFSAPDCECRHDHVFQKAKMIDDLIKSGPSAVDEIASKAVACTITKEENLILNRYKALDGWERYRKAGITVIDARTGIVFSANSSER
jgi:hypothetical protein